MQFIRKRFLLILLLFSVYLTFFLTHLPTPAKNVLGVASNLLLFVQPDTGRDPLLSAINSAQKEIDVEVYLLSDADITVSLVEACQRGVVVKIMLEEHPFGGGNINTKTKQQLEKTCVQILWTNPAFALTHEKAIVIDDQKVFILNQNLTTSSFTKNREYNIVDTNPEDVTQVKKIFLADWNRSSSVLANSNLVLSPVNARSVLSGLIAQSIKYLDIEVEVIDDPDVIKSIKQKSKTISVRIIIPSFSQINSNKKIAQELVANGVLVKTLSSPYIHAKLILTEAKAYVGSVNLTTQSMDSNRELGILIAQRDIIDELTQYFENDWIKASALSH